MVILNNVYYINLESRTDRKYLVEEELNKLKWNYTRFNAIKTENGRIGCSLSHLALLEMARDNNLEYIVILEDDIQFKNIDLFNKLLKEFLENTDKNDYDVLLLAGNIRPPYEKINNICLKIYKSWTTTGYIVKKHYYNKLIANIKTGIQYLIKYPNMHQKYSIDCNWFSLQKSDNWYILYPRTITQRPGYSNIENKTINYDHLMLDNYLSKYKVSVNLMGGLGNQLFQIFATIAYCLKFDKKYIFYNTKTLKIGKERITYWNTFLNNLTENLTNEYIKFPIYKEKSFHYSEIPFINQDFMLLGYYQSYKYFEDKFEDIKKLIKFNEIKNNIINKYWKNIIDNNQTSTISIHFRLGDYKNKQNYHPIQKIDYYKNSIQHIITNTNKKKYNILYFCEEEDNETVNLNIKELYTELHNIDNSIKLNFIKVKDSISDYEQMILMSNCNHNIIANSSFSWFGAYFNDNKNKIVCYPNIWFGPDASNNNLSDLCPNDWIKIN